MKTMMFLFRSLILKQMATYRSTNEKKDLENNAPMNVDIITAGNGDMQASAFGSLSTIVIDTNGNSHHF